MKNRSDSPTPLHPAFTLRKKLFLEELQATLYEIEHIQSGAQLMHIEADDPENLFCLSFRTYPINNRGTAHVLEHTVLCGSEKFPVKDPFFSMQRRSLNTFMNAMTGSDFTCYPASSQVERDFYNLFEVYIDAVFHPELKPLSFAQEGHRYEWEEGKLVHKGVVFNEMKGAFSSSDGRMWHHLFRHLFPTIVYGHDSGGVPREIAKLSHKELLSFHERFYHPSQCLFYTYGDIPLAKHLSFLEEQILKDVEKSAPLEPIGKQERFDQPRFFTEKFPSTSDEDKPILAIGYLTCALEEQETLLSLILLDAVLMDTDASPLKRAILDTKLCTNATSYVDNEMSEIPSVLICKGCEEGKLHELEEAIFTSLKKIAEEGIDPQLAKSALHQLEFDRSEITGDGGPFGLTLFFRSALAKQHGCPSENALQIHAQFATVLKQIEDRFYLSQLIRKYYLENRHRVTIHLLPSKTLSQEEEQFEQEGLAKKTAEMPPAEKEKLIQEAERLKSYQEEIEAQSLDCLPLIGIHDIPKHSQNFPLLHSRHGDVSIYQHDCFTNHIVYASLCFDLPALSVEEMMAAKLMISLIPELGLKGRSYEENLAFLYAYTGGIQTTFALNKVYGTKGTLRPLMQVRGKALSRHIAPLFSVMHDVLLYTRFDEKARIKELILQLATAVQSRLVRSSLSYATGLSLANWSAGNFLHECLHGLRYYHYITDLAQNIDQRLPLLMETFELLKYKLFHGHGVDLVISCDEADRKRLEKEHYFGISSIPKTSFHPWDNPYSIPPVASHARIVNSPVSFSSLGTQTVRGPGFDAPSLAIAARLFDNLVLHRRIREQGGAYGSGANYYPLTGNFNLYSYRDPHINSTRAAFAEAIDLIGSGDFEEEDLAEAKLECIQALDTPVSPGARAMVAYNWLRGERTLADRQLYRQLLLDVNANQVCDSVQKNLANLTKEGTFVVFASQELLEKEALPFPSLAI